MTTEGTCDGVGNCAAGAEIACAPYACAGDVCGSTCSADNECAMGNHCASGVCVTGRARGAECVLDSDCTSRHCADDVCCDTACDGQCEACAVAGSIGVCTQIAGAPMGSRSPCASGASCQDGTCTTPVKPTSGGGCSCGPTSSPLPMLWLCAISLCELLGRRRRAS